MVARTASIIDLSEYDECINALIYGNTGVGKTVLGGSAPDTLILGIESGLISAKRRGSTAKAWVVNDWTDIEKAFIWLRDHPNHGFRWVVIDSITDMQEKLLRWILDREMAAGSAKNRDEDIPQIQDHQKWQNMMRRFVNQFNSLPVNVLYTALEMRRENEEGEDIILPLITGKDYEISQIICGKMHVVGRMSTRVKEDGPNKTVSRRIQFTNIPPYFAKDRFDCLPDYMPAPTIPKIEKIINDSGALKKKAAATRAPRTRRTRRTTTAGR